MTLNSNNDIPLNKILGQVSTASKCFYVQKLHEAAIANIVEGLSNLFQDSVTEVAREQLGLKSMKKQSWITDDTIKTRGKRHSVEWMHWKVRGELVKSEGKGQ